MDTKDKKEIQEKEIISEDERKELEQFAYKMMAARMWDIVFALIDKCDELGIDVEDL
jgi:hypothetical protein